MVRRRPFFPRRRVDGARTSAERPKLLRARTFRIHPEADAEGFFVQSKHVLVTFAMSGLWEIELAQIMEAGIMMNLDLSRTPQGVELAFSSAYGVHGRIVAREVEVSFEPLDLL